jgi:hypothetical protein
MRGAKSGLRLAVVHAGMLMLVGGKFLYDRATLPRAWVRVSPVTPELPIRGRYLSLRMELDSVSGGGLMARLAVREGRLHGELNDRCCLAVHAGPRPVLVEPMAFFVPEHDADPSLRAPGEELWAEVSVPRRGVPRPLRLAVKRGGQFTVLALCTALPGLLGLAIE